MNGSHARVVPELFDGDRLRQARIYKGLKKVDLAKAIDVTPAVVGQYESGKTRPSTSVFASIALHLGFGPEFFERRGPVPQVTEGQAHFRKLRSTSKLERDQALVRLEFFSEVLADVETHVELPAVDLPEYPVDDDAAEAEPEAAAAAVRSAWGLGTGPIDNVVRLLEGRGIVVIRPAVGSSGVDAFSTILSDRPVVVLGNDKGDTARSRFDASHELGHLVMHHDAEPGRHIVEKQAHRFAAAFLMPADVIGREFPARMSWPAFFDLKQRWRVSLQALLYRARTLGFLSADAYQRAQIHISRQGWRDNEPIDIGQPEEPALLGRAFDLMRSELAIDETTIARECRLPDNVFRGLLEGAVSPSHDKPRVAVE
jgi:Zn-dependent peptidase ImmA (M78 family)/transcriptional regulator with XRE-family HTH domain